MPVNDLMTGLDLCRALGIKEKNVTKITIVADRHALRVTTESMVESGNLEPLLQDYVLVKKSDASE